MEIGWSQWKNGARTYAGNVRPDFIVQEGSLNSRAFGRKQRALTTSNPQPRNMEQTPEAEAFIARIRSLRFAAIA